MTVMHVRQQSAWQFSHGKQNIGFCKVPMLQQDFMALGVNRRISIL